MDQPTFESQVGGIAALDHPLSRRAYQLVVDEGRVGRDTASAALRVARSVAAFHLDELVSAGLLDAGVVDGIDGTEMIFDAELAPEPGSCCVRLRSR